MSNGSVNLHPTVGSLHWTVNPGDSLVDDTSDRGETRSIHVNPGATKNVEMVR